MRQQNFFLLVDRMSTNFFSFDMGGAVDDHILFLFLTPRFFSEIFMVKVESCPKLHKHLDIFCPPIF